MKIRFDAGRLYNLIRFLVIVISIGALILAIARTYSNDVDLITTAHNKLCNTKYPLAIIGHEPSGAYIYDQKITNDTTLKKRWDSFYGGGFRTSK